MAFAFTSWYFVILALVAGIVASLIIFLKMDKKDKALIDEFVKENLDILYNVVEKISAEILNLEGVLVLNDYFEYPVTLNPNDKDYILKFFKKHNNTPDIEKILYDYSIVLWQCQ